MGTGRRVCKTRQSWIATAGWAAGDDHAASSTGRTGTGQSQRAAVRKKSSDIFKAPGAMPSIQQVLNKPLVSPQTKPLRHGLPRGRGSLRTALTLPAWACDPSRSSHTSLSPRGFTGWVCGHLMKGDYGPAPARLDVRMASPDLASAARCSETLPICTAPPSLSLSPASICTSLGLSPSTRSCYCDFLPCS